MKDVDGEELHPAAFYTVADEGEDGPAELGAKLIGELPEFTELAIDGPRIAWLMRHGVKEKAGRVTLGEMVLPRFQGSLGSVGAWALAHKLGAVPDFLCILDAGWWDAATPHQRAGLVHHELKHLAIATDKEGEKRFDDEGRPVWALVGHDLEEFADTVRRYGDYAGDLAPFLAAAREGGAA